MGEEPILEGMMVDTKSKALGRSETRVGYRECLIVGRHKGSERTLVARKHKEILGRRERNSATPAIGNAGSVLGESTSGCPRRAPRHRD